MAEKQQFLDFIEEYKTLRQLWDVKSEEYKNKNARRRAYEKLLVEYKKVDCDANLDIMKNKIKSIRSIYRRERKKIVRSERSIGDSDDVYIPNLWYFNSLEFLKEQELPSTMSSDDEYQNMSNAMQSISMDEASTELLRKAIQCLDESKSKVKDDAAIYSEAWACTFRKLTPDQQLYAKQAVDEIMLLGQINRLTLNYIRDRNNANEMLNTTYLTRGSTPYSSSLSSLHQSCDLF